MNPRVRFAPSPTGFLHIGGARTALFNYLFARHHQGQFILRIEDTDKERSTQEATDAILEGLTWLGLSWDEGPFFQSQRNELYHAACERLLKTNHAYRCYCTPEELEQRRNAQLHAKQAIKYDGRCREFMGKILDKPHIIRFVIPEGTTQVNDLVKGKTSYNNQELEDFVILRSDGSPTYNFVVVVDDVDMKITHVIRGDDHLNNTPKQIHLYHALQASLPEFAHLPLILGPDRSRLSKRHGATSVQAYRDMGYLPQALNNFLARLGWSHGDQEIFSMDELIQHFDIQHIGIASGVFNAEKLLWLNQHYLKELPLPVLFKELQKFASISSDFQFTEASDKALLLFQERSQTIQEMAQLSQWYFQNEIQFEEGAAQTYLTANIKETFQKLLSMLRECDRLDEEQMKPKFEIFLKEIGLKMKEVAQPLRVALTGSTKSPGIFEVIAILGKDRVIQRLENVIKKL